MKKRIFSLLSAFALGLFIANTAVNTAVLPAYAAEQSTQDQQSQQSDDQKENSSSHAGHHG